MITPSRLRRLALALPETLEHRQGGSTSFRVRGRTFASLARRDGRAVLELSREQQDALTRAHPSVFAAGRRRRRQHGPTLVELRFVDGWLLEELLVAAWRRVAPRRSAGRWDAERTAAALPAPQRTAGRGRGAKP